MTIAGQFVKSRAALLSFLLLGVMAAGSAYSLRLGDRTRYPDERDYMVIAQNLAAKGVYSRDGVQPTAYRPPGYPVCLALVCRLGGSAVAARLLNYAALCGSLLLLYLLAGRKAGQAAVVLGAGYVVLFYTASTLYPQTLATTLLLGVCALVFTGRAVPARRFVLAGVLCGALILLVPAFVFTVALLCVFLAAERRKTGLRRAFVIAVTAGLVLVPWSIRNARAFRSLVFVSTNGGVNLLLGNSENTRPNSGVNVDISPYTSRAPAGEIERNRFYAASAFEYIAAHPGRAAGLYVLKFLNYFNYRNELYTRNEASSLRNLVMLITYGGLVLLVLLRLWSSRRRPLSRYERFVLLLYVLNGAFAAVFFTRIRFRIPFDAMLTSVAAVAVAGLFDAGRAASGPARETFADHAGQEDGIADQEASP